jgi:cytochrome b-561
LLPWDQLACWAITVGTSIARQAPIVGPTIQLALLGGHEIGQQTLLRFYVLHVFFLPAFVWILFAYHMWRVRKDSGLAVVERLRHERKMAPKATPTTKSCSLFGPTPGTSVQVLSSTGFEEDDQVLSSPNLTRRIALVFLVVFNLTLLAPLAFDAPLEGLANPAITPNPAKAPWYFVWLQELVASTTIHLGPLTVSGAFLGGILIPGFLLIILTIWPWLDRSPQRAEGRWFSSERRRQNAVFIGATFPIVVLIVSDVYLRGPYWRI